MGSLADITLGDIGRALARYRPVAVTVAIILVVLAVLPGPRRAALNALPSGAPTPAAAAPADAASADVPASELPAPVADDSSSSTFDGGSSSSSSSFDSSSSSSSFGSSDSSSDDDSSSSDEFSSDFSSDDFSAGSSSSDGTSSSTSSRPLVVTEAGWGSAGGGTPIGSTGVPAGALPVAKRIGQVDKYSYVRLDGEQKVLTLKVNPENGRTTTGAVGVSICQITEGDWVEGENVPSDAAPAYDVATCIPGDPGDGTAWTFNLLTFSSPSDPRGFALVPTGESIDYQINFSRS